MLCIWFILCLISVCSTLSYFLCAKLNYFGMFFWCLLKYLLPLWRFKEKLINQNFTMKKLTFCLMALAMVASTMFTSCGSDDDDDDNGGGILDKINSLSASVKGGSFSTSAAGFYQAASEATETGTSKLSDFFGGSTEGTTTIAGTEKGKQLAINIKGTKSGTYELSLGTSDEAVANAIVTVLGGGSVKDAIKNAVKTDAMVIYRASGDEEGSATYYMSTQASVTVNFDLLVYSEGSFTATMVNSAKDTFTITDGRFQVFGKPVIKTSSSSK